MGKLEDWTVTSLKENGSSGNRSCIFWPLRYHSFETESRIRSQSCIFVQNLSFSLMLYTFSCQQKVKCCSPSEAAVATGWAHRPWLLLHSPGAGLVAGVGALALNAALPDLSRGVLCLAVYFVLSVIGLFYLSVLYALDTEIQYRYIGYLSNVPCLFFYIVIAGLQSTSQWKGCMCY